MKESIVDLLLANKCYCQKKNKVISLQECDIDCHREQSCRKKHNREYGRFLNEGRK